MPPPLLEKSFNIAGPCKAETDYLLPPTARFNMPEIMQMIRNQRYFVLHAPRQTGKTTALIALMHQLNAEGEFRALYANVEAGQAARENIEQAMPAIVASLGRAAHIRLKEAQTLSLAEQIIKNSPPLTALTDFLGRWCAECDKPTVLMLDEVDALVGDTLISLLRQLRAGYADRPRHFPQTIILCGVRDVRDYRIHSSSAKEIITGGSAFNIKTESLRLGDFNENDVFALLQQHTDATGQPFTSDAMHQIWHYSQGQPWLVNALSREVTQKMREGRDRRVAITAAMVDEAKERLILERTTHLDQLTDKLREPRVRRVIEPMLSGDDILTVPEDDKQYVIDLGLVHKFRGGGLAIANPIYKEVIPRELSLNAQDSIALEYRPSWRTPDGKLDEAKLLEAFLAFWREHGQPLFRSVHYTEVAPHIVLLAFLQRLVNGGGTILREYAIGTRRMDILVTYGEQRLAMELKVWREGRKDPTPQGLAQLDKYLTGLGLDTGWLVIFDQRAGLPDVEDRTSSEVVISPAGRQITLIRG
ncbi:MAG: DEAD/DEAH box helicase family protein [Anaerolineae bacterium]|nr:DEAD/DEAH box helicase family protein [Anaerolineae bacterium]